MAGSGTGTPVSSSAYPVTLAEAKAHLNIEDDDDNDYITTLIAAATDYVQRTTDIQFITGDVTLKLDRFPSGTEYYTGHDWRPTLNDSQVYDSVLLTKSPVISIGSVTYLDAAGASQTLATSVYALDNTHQVARMHLKYNQSWPDIRGDVDGITITYSVGYGVDGSTAPASLKAAIKLLVAHWYENREAAVQGQVVRSIPFAVDSLIGANKLGRLV
jgi:uncharacterized phiE125 gp8 family phage protein